MTQTSKVRWTALSMVAVLGTGALMLNGGQASAGVDDITFDAVTSAYGVEFRLTNPSIPTGIAIEGSGPTSQAKLTSIPQSNAFASLPYPGDTGANFGGLASGVSGLPVPDYPLYVQSANGNPAPEEGHFPGIDLSARTADNLSTAKAIAFTDAAGYTAESTINQAKDGSVSAVSAATQNGLQIGGVLTLSGVLSTARADLDSFGKLTTASSLTVTRFIAPAANLTLPSEFNPPNSASIPNPFQGQVLSSPDISYSAGTFFVTIPGAGPQKFPVPESAVVDAFSSIGVGLSVQKAVSTETGVTAPTLVLTSVLPAPPANQLYTGETPVTYTIGRTSADIVGSNTADATSGVLPSGAAGSPVAGAPVAGVADGAAGVDGIGLGALPTTVGQLPGSAPATVDLLPAPGAGADGIVAAQNGKDLPGIAPFYFVLIIAAVLGLLGGQVLAYVGVRSAWRS